MGSSLSGPMIINKGSKGSCIFYGVPKYSDSSPNNQKHFLHYISRKGLKFRLLGTVCTLFNISARQVFRPSICNFGREEEGHILGPQKGKLYWHVRLRSFVYFPFSNTEIMSVKWVIIYFFIYSFIQSLLWLMPQSGVSFCQIPFVSE